MKQFAPNLTRAEADNKSTDLSIGLQFTRKDVLPARASERNKGSKAGHELQTENCQ